MVRLSSLLRILPLAGVLLPLRPASAFQPCATGAVRELRRADTRAARGGEECHAGKTPGPETLHSALHPIAVHFPPELAADAARAIVALDLAWDVQVGEMGWPEPLPDAGLCGSDDLDVFLDTTTGYGYTDSATPDLSTPYDDWSAFIVLDVLAYGGDALEATLVHEFNHVCQAALDWWEPIAYFEMSAQYVEYLVWPMDYMPLEVVPDFAGHPAWAVDHDDDYETWFMYGAAEFLLWADASCVAGDPLWLSDVWRAARSEAGPDTEVPNEPDLRDAMSQILGEACGLDWWDATARFRAEVWDGAGNDTIVAASGGWVDPVHPTTELVDLTDGGSAEVILEAEDTGAVYVEVLVSTEAAGGLAPATGPGWLLTPIPTGEPGRVLFVATPEPDRTVDADDPAPGLRTGILTLTLGAGGDDDSTTDDDDSTGSDDDGDDDSAGQDGEGCACGSAGSRQGALWGSLLAAGAFVLGRSRRRPRRGLGVPGVRQMPPTPPANQGRRGTPLLRLGWPPRELRWPTG